MPLMSNFESHSNRLPKSAQIANGTEVADPLAGERFYYVSADVRYGTVYASARLGGGKAAGSACPDSGTLRSERCMSNSAFRHCWNGEGSERDPKWSHQWLSRTYQGCQSGPITDVKTRPSMYWRSCLADRLSYAAPTKLEQRAISQRERRLTLTVPALS